METPAAAADDATALVCPVRPAEVGEATVTEIRGEDGRNLLVYRWAGPGT